MNFKEKLTQITTFVFDVDGVFSGGFSLTNDGDLIRTMNAKDGFAVKMALKKGYTIGIITGGNSKSVKIRFQKLGITDIYMNSKNKLDDFRDFFMKYDINPESILYMGDDLPDIEPMINTGLATCPSDAAIEVKEISHYISNKKGGEGCVRDVIEQVLRVQNNWSY